MSDVDRITVRLPKEEKALYEKLAAEDARGLTLAAWCRWALSEIAKYVQLRDDPEPEAEPEPEPERAEPPREPSLAELQSYAARVRVQRRGPHFWESPSVKRARADEKAYQEDARQLREQS